MSEQDYWNGRQLENYQAMRSRHRELWNFVAAYVAQHRIRNVLEVGCGMIPPIRKLVPNYVGIDRNENTNAIHVDFLTMDVEPWHGIELFLACGVIEHCAEGYVQFLRQAYILQPQHAIISFFFGLNRSDNILRHTRKGNWKNRYAQHLLAETLNELDLNWEFKLVGLSDTVLILRRRKDGD